MKENMTFEEAVNDGDIKAMAKSIVRKYQIWIDRYDIYEDLYNVCLWGLWKGLSTYDKSRGTKLSTHLYIKMWDKTSNYIKNTYKGYKGDKGKFNLEYDFLDREVSTLSKRGMGGVQEGIFLGDTISSYDPDVAFNIDLYNAFDTLTEREKEILVAKVVLAIPHKILQERYGIQRSTVDAILQRAKKKIRKYMEDDIDKMV